MRWSEFAAKECVDLLRGEKLGSLSHADLTFNQQTGKIESILVPIETSWFRKKNKEVCIHWRTIRKVGPEMIIIESSGKLID